MSTQSEAVLEKELVQQLSGLGYDFISEILANLKHQFGKFNNTTFSDREFNQILNHLSKGNIFERAKILRDRLALERDNEETTYLRFYNSEDWSQNLFQVTHQVTIKGVYKNRSIRCYSVG